MIPDIKHFLEKNGKESFAYKSLQYPGQILGCNLEAAKKIESKVDCFLCISAGEFYADGIVLMTEKPVFVLDFHAKEYPEISRGITEEEFEKAVSYAKRLKINFIK